MKGALKNPKPYNPEAQSSPKAWHLEYILWAPKALYSIFFGPKSLLICESLESQGKGALGFETDVRADLTETTQRAVEGRGSLKAQSPRGSLLVVCGLGFRVYKGGVFRV